MLHEVSLRPTTDVTRSRMDLCSGLQTEGNCPGDPRIWGTFRRYLHMISAFMDAGYIVAADDHVRTWEDSNGQ